MVAVGCVHPGRNSLVFPGGPSAGESGASKSDSGDSGSGQQSDDSSKSDSSKSDSGQSENILSTTVVVSVLALGALIVVGVLAISDTSQQSTRQRAQQYLQEHRRTVQMALSQGSGPMIDDIAMSLSLPAEHLPRLGAAVQRQRPGLSAYLSDGVVTIEEAEGFCAALVKAIDADPVLSPYVVALSDKLVESL